MAHLTEAQIITAAEGFVNANNRTPTYEELRQALGGGSPSTLNKYYRNWRLKKDAELLQHNGPLAAVVEKLPIPEIITEQLAVAWSLAVSNVRGEAKKEIEAIHSLMRSENEKHQNDVAERDEIISTLEMEYAVLQDAYENSIESGKARELAVASELQARTAEVEQKGRDLATQGGRICEMEKQLLGYAEAALVERQRTDDAVAEASRLKALLAVRRDSEA